MKNSLAMLAVTAILVGGGPAFVREVHAGPLVQVVELSGHRTRFDNANPASIRLKSKLGKALAYDS